jgi:NAD(P)-dependent dehydrogenase (short-subunit alcohol dehydrogenase family)
MSVKTVLITGATSGIGKEVAMQLGVAGCDLVLACRDVSAADRVAAEIAARAGGRKPAVLQVDTSSRRSIAEFGRAARERLARLDVLINNAGVNRPNRELTDDGIERTFATNVLGYHLVIRELDGLLRKSAPARIVNVASTFASNLDLDDLQFERRPYNNVKAYAQSKACNRLLTWALSRRLAGSGVTANAMAPGLIMTGLYRDMKFPMRTFIRVLSVFKGRTVEQGAGDLAWLATDPSVEGRTGLFWFERKETRCQFRGEADEEKLWATCERLSG